MNSRAWVAMLAAALCFSACSKKEADHGKPATPRQPTQIDPGTVATISGTVKFEGTSPEPQKIDMSPDPACGNQAHFDESLVVEQGKLANVFVYVKDPFPTWDVYFPPPAQPVVIEQKTCQYQPHVAASMPRQAIEFINDDEATHNIHPMPKENRQWNEAQMPKADPITKTFDHVEIMIPVKCNQHPWMRMYLNVADSPFFAVTGSDGRFNIKGLPPGTYTIAAVQELLGEQDMKITVGPKDSKSVDFTFKQQR